MSRPLPERLPGTGPARRAVLDDVQHDPRTSHAGDGLVATFDRQTHVRRPGVHSAHHSDLAPDDPRQPESRLGPHACWRVCDLQRGEGAPLPSDAPGLPIVSHSNVHISGKAER
jgi:hypothetical protein